ncbi:Holliday junction-specific endonuclease [Metamycoplasma cloacale]|uniref:Holliday junction resolvase RecU n=1 Tax=Metamycoplasma cloacale TaxID=92401 RepID=A0A2Z4LMA9_9BACT|nr:Holliday junction resolvase RecU [Metamycoplasma cloacale]AWX42850.1 Holliday junction resolvase RecU [Metamycoplasma cloacale]VEU79328.1 Holliday junction-specific endonuclease [Metamycoplasma cloacale]
MSNYRNRGMFLESIINATNMFYLNRNIAMIHKKNLDITFKNVNVINKELQLTGTKIKSKSTVDYYGIYKGRFLAFEAKSTEEKNFSLNNIKNHQIEYLDLITKFGGITFWIFYFKLQNKFIFINHNNFKKIISNKKHLKFDEILKSGIEISLEFPGIIDYLSLIEWN